LGSELQSIYVDRLREKGGSEKQVVLPSNSGKLRVPKPDWDLANRVYSWLGRSKGELQIHVKSAHDVSEGGLLTALSEGLMARSLGALIHVPADLDSWEFCFGEGFHGVVVSAREVDAKSLELEWNDLDVPFFKIGSVTYDPNLVVRSEKTSASWSVAVAKLRKAWEVSGYWE
jgi:phosphoribosylformylglycinamidine synthase subunit PurL